MREDKEGDYGPVKAKLAMPYTGGMGNRERGGGKWGWRGWKPGSGGGRGYKRAMGRLKMAKWVKRR